ncbi:hypothetical protein LTR66_005961 [Elasticomyces elasticus]|nr:hypothetical protein LTR66_005961 [Elasticomyces elasticus]
MSTSGGGGGRRAARTIHRVPKEIQEQPQLAGQTDRSLRSPSASPSSTGYGEKPRASLRPDTYHLGPIRTEHEHLWRATDIELSGFAAEELSMDPRKDFTADQLARRDSIPPMPISYHSESDDSAFSIETLSTVSSFARAISRDQPDRRLFARSSKRHISQLQEQSLAQDTEERGAKDLMGRVAAAKRPISSPNLHSTSSAYGISAPNAPRIQSYHRTLSSGDEARTYKTLPSPSGPVAKNTHSAQSPAKNKPVRLTPPERDPRIRPHITSQSQGYFRTFDFDSESVATPMDEDGPSVSYHNAIAAIFTEPSRPVEYPITPPLPLANKPLQKHKKSFFDLFRRTPPVTDTAVEAPKFSVSAHPHPGLPVALKGHASYETLSRPSLFSRNHISSYLSRRKEASDSAISPLGTVHPGAGYSPSGRAEHSNSPSFTPTPQASPQSPRGTGASRTPLATPGETVVGARKSSEYFGSHTSTKGGIRTRPSLNYLPTEMHRVNTPPQIYPTSPRLTSKPSGSIPRGFFFDIRRPLQEPLDSPRIPVPMESKASMPHLDPPLTSKHQSIVSRSVTVMMDQFRVRLDHISDEEEESENDFELNVPEHLPNSPLCPLNPKHKSGGKAICPLHGRKKTVLRQYTDPTKDPKSL